MRNLSYENQFYSQVHSDANLTHFHMNALGLVFGQSGQKATRKWPISPKVPALTLNVNNFFTVNLRHA